MKELRLLCAEDEQGRTCWMTALRLFKVTQQMSEIYHFTVCFSCFCILDYYDVK